MMIVIFLSLCISFALGSSNLPELAECKMEGDCQAGLKCVLTKRLIVSGTVYPVKQCMPEGVDIDVETVDLDNQSDNVSRVKRFLFNSCSSESECQSNFCCALGKRCAPKLGEYFTCYFVDKHKCGCGNGLACKVTTTIKLPFGIKIPIKQCVKAT
ncbi:unnamed protein product [Porites lobata]|uniref:Uncharacterized protein n=1 Tax=Porites lobata TaxID=104759 RepID=A0ABN8QL20_9CNID|nr:unnamed protein product [Porites lobata]